jgi:hypothetical protein
MKVQKFAAGAVFVAAATAGMFGAAPAFAGPGINFDNGTGGQGNVKLGDTSATGATALATKGNQALAINTGLGLSPVPGGGSSAVALGGNGNSAVAIDGFTLVAGGQNNHGFAALGATAITGGHTNNVVTVAGASGTDPYSHDNAIVNFGGNVASSGQPTNDPGGTFVNLCGSSVWGQAAHIHVSKGAC